MDEWSVAQGCSIPFAGWMTQDTHLDQMRKKGFQGPSLYTLCWNQEESMELLLNVSPFTEYLWMHRLLLFGSLDQNINNLVETLQRQRSQPHCHQPTIAYRSIVTLKACHVFGWSLLVFHIFIMFTIHSMISMYLVDSMYVPVLLIEYDINSLQKNPRSSPFGQGLSTLVPLPLVKGSLPSLLEFQPSSMSDEKGDFDRAHDHFQP